MFTLLFKSVEKCPRAVQDLICSLIMDLTLIAGSSKVFPKGESAFTYDQCIKRRDKEILQEFYQQNV